MATPSTTSPDTVITLKINIDGTNKRFKLPLRDLGASTLPGKVCPLLLHKLRLLLLPPPFRTLRPPHCVSADTPAWSDGDKHRPRVK